MTNALHNNIITEATLSVDHIMLTKCAAQVEGNLIRWQKWNIRHSFNYREGLVLHDVGCAHHPPCPKGSDSRLEF